MAETLKLGNGNWATKKDSLLAYNSENNNFKPLPFNFTRNSSATRVNKEGLIEVVSNNEPRIDFKDSSEGALLLEPTRSNYILKSDDVLSTYQSQNGDVSDASEPINGFNNSIQIEYDASGSLVYKRDFNPTIGTEYTISLFVQMNDNSEPIHTVDANSGDFSLINNNSFASASDIKTERLGSTNVYRVSSTITATSTNNRFGIIKYSTQSLKGFKVTGFQIEQGSYTTSYIPTQGSAVTRTLEISRIDNLDDYVSSETSWTATGEFVKGQDKDNSKYIFYAYYLASSNLFRIRDYTNSVRFYLFEPSEQSYGFSANLDETIKWAIRAKSDGTYSVYINGGLLIETSGTFRKLDGYNIVTYAKNTINNLRVYNTALTDAELQSLTS